MSETRPGTGRRLLFLDALRGLAALAVVVSHASERVFPLIDHTNTHWFQLGQFGVTLFFFTSGFVIPMTLERGSLRRFWTSRLFRLFPLYLCVLGALAVLSVVGLWHQSDLLTPGQWLLNITMVQGLLTEPDALGTFWSLAWEMLFYVVMCGLYLLKLHIRTATLAVTVLVIANVQALHPHLPELGSWYPVWWMFLAQMLTGTVFYRWVNGQLSLPRALAVFALYVATAVHVAWAYMGGMPPATGGTWGFRPMVTAWTAGILVFGAACLLRQRTMPRVLVWLGTVSYSLYLVHIVVMDIGRPLGGPSRVFIDGKTTVALYVAVSLTVAALTYRFIERPCVALGRRLTRVRVTAPPQESADVRIITTSAPAPRRASPEAVPGAAGGPATTPLRMITIPVPPPRSPRTRDLIPR